MSVILSFQSSGIVPGDGQPVRMRGSSLTVGRAPGNDLVLADPERTLSKTHCVIEDHNGNVVVVDLSTNGTFLNYSRIPLGRTPTPLNDGDVLSLGGYEIVVRIEQAAAPAAWLPDPLAEEAISHGDAGRAPDPLDLLDAPGPEGDFLDDLLGSDAPAGPGRMGLADPMDELLPPLGEEDEPLLPGPAPAEPAHDSPLLHAASVQDRYQPAAVPPAAVIPEDWDLDPFHEEDSPAAPPAAPQPFVAPPPAPAAAPQAAPPPPVAVAPPIPAPPQPAPAAPAYAAPPSPAPQPQAAAAGNSFFAGLDVEDLAVPAADVDSTMARMGRMMRIMISGLREILMTRTGIKSEFRIEQTMIGASGNNPLKFSISPEQAIEALVRPRSRGYLDAEAAVAEALRDIKAHEVAMVTGMEAALKGVLARLDPKALAAQIEAQGSRGGLFKGRKAMYWEVYEKMYAQISDQAENDFHELFSREFARAYKDQLDRLK